LTRKILLIFKLVQELPFAAASIGQVHRAKIVENGVEKTVVVKVQVSEILFFFLDCLLRFGIRL
jgi:predicted unusual protein kinase regulating ubiquinone biosynthesis (AarF/ABC1/UbiB family)